MAREMGLNEQAQMLSRCSTEIKDLRRQIDRLAPKAEAYDALLTVLNLLPKGNRSTGEDIAWLLDKRLSELQAVIDEGNKAAKVE